MSDFHNESMDLQQDIARASFGDMLHDSERNRKYYEAIAFAIEERHARGEEALVLDIGTGTGLLSMMAAEKGADEVVACEGFKPMASCATRIIEKNDLNGRIRIVPKRSTELLVGKGKDLRVRANILVTEIFDTDLIGEDAILTYRHAHQHLITADCFTIPHKANIYVQIVESPLVWAWNQPKMLADLDGEVLLKPPPSILVSKGTTVSHDIQLSQLSRSSFKPLSEPTAVLSFDFSGKTELSEVRTVQKIIKSLESGSAQAIFVWWDLDMDSTGHNIVLSCAPYWAHPDLSSMPEIDRESRFIPWRDHWMQAIYYIPTPISLQQNEEFQLTISHNEYILWFDISKNLEPVFKILPEPSLCDSVFYSINSRTRIGQLNDHRRNKRYIKYMENHLKQHDTVLAISDGSLITLASARLGAKHVYLLQENQYHKTIIDMYIKHNNIKNVTILNNLEEFDKWRDITHVISEPYFTQSILPWENFQIGNYLQKVLDLLNDSVRISPQKAKIFAMPVKFVDLQKIRQPVRDCEGFNMTIFDELIKYAQDSVDDTVEAHPLWEYPCKAVGHPVELLEVDFVKYNTHFTKHGQMKFDLPGRTCNGVALWVNWYLDENVTPQNTVCSGPIGEIQFEENIEWDMYTRQGVYLFATDYHISTNNYIDWKLDFNCENSKLKCNFEMIQ